MITSFGIGIITYFDSFVVSFDRVVVYFYSCLQYFYKFFVDCVIFRFQRRLIYIGVKCVILESISFSCRLLPSVGVYCVLLSYIVFSQRQMRTLGDEFSLVANCTSIQTCRLLLSLSRFSNNLSVDSLLLLFPVYYTVIPSNLHVELRSHVIGEVPIL